MLGFFIGPLPCVSCSCGSTLFPFLRAPFQRSFLVLGFDPLFPLLPCFPIPLGISEPFIGDLFLIFGDVLGFAAAFPLSFNVPLLSLFCIQTILLYAVFGWFHEGAE